MEPTLRPATSPAATTTLTLDVVIARLAGHEIVDGVLLMGSTADGALSPTSDVDLLVVLSDLPAPLSMVSTWIDGRLAEVYVATTRGIERVVARSAAWPDQSEEGVVLTWLQSGRVAYDRAGRLAAAQAIARAAPAPALPGDREIYDAWRKIGYNVAQIERYLASDDPLAALAIDLRLLYSLDEVKAHYFTARRIPWRGEKPALRHLAAYDPIFLDLLRQCLAESDRRRKIEQYIELARLALAPVGRLWEYGTTVVAPGPGFGGADPEPPGTIDDALAFWDGLAAG